MSEPADPQPLPNSGLRREASRNALLSAVDDDVRRRLAANFELVALGSGTVLHEPGEALHYVYFPLECVVSVMQVLGDGHSVQVAVIGREGLVGTQVFMGGGSSRMRAVVQQAGKAIRIPSAMAAAEFQQGGSFMQRVLRHTQAVLAQMAQTAVCARHHTPQQQLCRWLLLTLDRVEAPEMRATQETIAAMLGVRRETVTEQVGKLQALSAIETRRGWVHVLDRGKVEQCACECYGVVRSEYERLLPFFPLPP